MPVLVAAIAFGLSVDYEVFLLSRMRERWLAGAPADVAVAEGLQLTGRIVTAAALLLAVVFAGLPRRRLRPDPLDRPGPGAGGPAGRDDRPDAAGAGDDDAAGPVQLVGAGAWLARIHARFAGGFDETAAAPPTEPRELVGAAR